VNQVNALADANPKVLRISMDAKATVKVGNFSRGGKKRVLVKTTDHDFQASAKVTPVGILLPQFDEVFLVCVTSKVTSDCLVDVLELWWQHAREGYDQVRTLVINLDNGPENQSHRTQFLKRLVDFAQTHQLSIELAYYPPYHSKYNPVERCWGILENHWNGDILDTIETVVNFARTMTWKGNAPIVRLLTTIYHTGVRLTKQAMTEVERHVERLSGLERWFLKISCAPSLLPDT
jgi:transposase